MSLEEITQPVEQEVVSSVGQQDLSKDVIFDLLKNQRRRAVIRYLVAADRTVTLAELSDQITARENDIPVERISSKQRKRVYVALYQTHLPKLDRAGVIEYESDRGTVVLTEHASVLQPYLDSAPGAETEGPDWTAFYFGLSITGGGATLGSHLIGLRSLAFQLSLGFSLVFVFVLVSFIYTYYKWNA